MIMKNLLNALAILSGCLAFTRSDQGTSIEVENGQEVKINCMGSQKIIDKSDEWSSDAEILGWILPDLRRIGLNWSESTMRVQNNGASR